MPVTSAQEGAPRLVERKRDTRDSAWRNEKALAPMLSVFRRVLLPFGVRRLVVNVNMPLHVFNKGR